ncbi:MAG: hypothetical protein IIA65_07040 [Planctomycetes bacterium]|nr:hypothetical protein [Planctomycetota bacterium]
MSHLTNEQIDDLLISGAREPDHLKDCDSCRAKVAQRRALGERLRKAFNSIEADDDLRNQIHAAVANNPQYGSHATAAAPFRNRARRRLYPFLGAAAAVILVAVPVAHFLGRPSQANAAQLELLQIHHHNLSEHGDMMTDLDPKSVEAYFEEYLDHAPDVVATGSGLNYCGCRVQTYRGQPVGSYVVDTSHAKVTVLTLQEMPEALGMKRMEDLSSGDLTVWGATCDCCNMAAVRVSGQTYYALGEASHEELNLVLLALAASSN